MNEGNRVRATHDSVYTIGIASRLAGVPISVIREYESWGLVIPHVTKTNRRVFSDVDISNLGHLRRLQSEYRLTLASLRFLVSLLPCWLLRPGCSEEESRRCGKTRAPGTPCWEFKVKADPGGREQCRRCRTYSEVSSLEKYQELIRSLFGGR